MRNLYRAVKVLPLLAILFATHAAAQENLPWRLEDYPSGGEALTGMIAGTLTAQGDLLAPTCNALKPGTVQQIVSGFGGIGMAIADSDSGNAALIVDALPSCWECRDFGTVDRRVELGAAIAVAARQLAARDLRYAQEVEIVVDMCEDDALQRSYDLTRGQDNLGQLIAQEGSESNTVLNRPLIVPVGGGGLPTTN